MNLDKDLISVQEARELVSKAKNAQLEFKHYNQNQVDKIVKAMVDAGYSASEKLAKLANEETGFGNWKDKVVKNQFGTMNVWDSIKGLKTVGVIDVQQNGKIVKIAEAMGVVAALIPSTNPTSTAMFKSIISLKCRNAIVASPHPKAANCTSQSMKILSDAAESAGAPKGLIQCLSAPTLEGTDALMKDKNIAVILATGSTPMVKAAYSSGTPAYGVGSGNVPAFIERSANTKKAVADIIYGTTFDYGTLCSSEQAMIVDRPVLNKVREEIKCNNGHILTKDEKIRVETSIAKNGRLNPEIVGKSASWIAEYAGLNLSKDVSVLIAECDEVGHDEPFSMEKLSPLLALYTVDGWLEGCHKCIELLKFGGIGHSMAIHSNDKDIIMKFALEKPAFRIVVNTPSSVGAVGYTTGLTPSLTLGPGTWGGSIVSENVSAKHLINIKTLAFEINPINSGNSVNSFSDNMNNKSNYGNRDVSFIDEIEQRLRDRAGNPKILDIERNKKSSANKSVFGSGISEAEIQKLIKDFNS